MSKIEAVLFDLDGTLLDSYPDFLAALETINPNKSEKIIDKSLVRANISGGSPRLLEVAFDINKDDKNLNVVWETITQGGRKHIIAQEYVDASKKGDNRLTFINYELLPKKLIRLASDSDFRGNLAVGATSKVEDVSDFDKDIAAKINP